jgi:hypothetical protein
MLRALELENPPWIYDVSDIGDADDMPVDALSAADGLGLSASATLAIARGLGGKVDVELRAAVGARGEEELVELMSSLWPGSTDHVARLSDGLGYDIALAVGGGTWHLEVKSTTRRGRLVVHLSRHEFDVAVDDPTWELVVVALDEGGVVGVATVERSHLHSLAPKDMHPRGRWESVELRLLPETLTTGLPFVGPVEAARFNSVISSRGGQPSAAFAWLPSGAT